MFWHPTEFKVETSHTRWHSFIPQRGEKGGRGGNWVLPAEDELQVHTPAGYDSLASQPLETSESHLWYEVIILWKCEFEEHVQCTVQEKMCVCLGGAPLLATRPSRGQGFCKTHDACAARGSWALRGWHVCTAQQTVQGAIRTASVQTLHWAYHLEVTGIHQRSPCGT